MQNPHLASPVPPMGWNSWDCYGAAVNEEQLLGNARYVAEHLKRFGFQYIVCDIQWYEPTADSNCYHPFADLCMDAWGRLLPAPNRFPRGFAPIAEEIHAMGLKFGIHILRGIPRQAVHQNLPVFGCSRTAREIAHPFSLCSWNTDMYGVDAQKEGAQAYYDSLFALYAAWGVDYVKLDDAAVTEFRPDCPYSAEKEIELIRSAINRCGREIVLSLSPGPARIENAAHLAANAELWRITGDLWDRWEDVKAMFARCAAWNGLRSPGHWPDCDMLPLGRISKTNAYAGAQNRYSNLTPDEQQTMLTLWCIFRSPLFLGGELRENRPQDLALLQHAAVWELDQHSSRNRPLFSEETKAAWICRDAKNTPVIALFNLSDAAQTVCVQLDACALTGSYTPVDLWEDRPLPPVYGKIAASLRAHACLLVRLESTAEKRSAFCEAHRSRS